MIYYLVAAIVAWLLLKLTFNSLNKTELLLVKYNMTEDEGYPWKSVVFGLLCAITSFVTLIIFLVKVGNKFLG